MANNLTPEAIKGLVDRGYSQNQIDIITKAAQSGGVDAAKKAISDIGPVVKTPVAAPVTKASVATPVPAPVVPPVAKALVAPPVAPVTPVAKTPVVPPVTPVTPVAKTPVVAPTPKVTTPTSKVTTPATPVPVVNAPITQAQLDALTPSQKTQIKTMMATDKEGARNLAVSFVNSTRKKNIPKAAVPALESASLLKQTPEQLAETKRKSLVEEKGKDLSAAQNKLSEGLAVIKSNSEAVRKLYGVDENGNVDMTNTNSLAFKIQSSLDNFKREKTKLLADQESSMLNQVSGVMRQNLASRGVDARNVSPELLNSLSGELGIKAFDGIAKLRESTVNSILGEEQNTLAKISELREKGLTSANDAKIASETLRTTVEETIRSINKQFVNDVIGVAEKETERKETKGADLVNAVTKFGTSLGLSGTGLASINSYLSKFTNPTLAINSMLSDLTNKNSELYKAVGAVEAAKLASAKAEYELKLLAQQANVLRAGKTGSKSASLTAQQATIAASLGLGSGYDQAIKDNYTTVLANVLAGRGFTLPDGTVISNQRAENALNEYRKMNIGAIESSPQQIQVTTTTNPNRKKNVVVTKK